MTQDLIVNFVIDRSGSMSDIWGAVISGFNEFKNEQASLPGNAWLTLTAFDDRIEVPYVAWNCKHIPNLTRGSHLNDVVYRTIGGRKVSNVPTSVSPYPNIYPRGMTALNDAILRAVNDTESWLTQNPWFTGKTLVVIFTDGLENASEATSQQARNRIAEKEAQGWEFLYLGANQDAFAVGHGTYG